MICGCADRHAQAVISRSCARSCARSARRAAAQAVAQQIQAQYEQQDRDAREQGELRRERRQCLRLIEHAPPAGRRRLRAQSDVGQPRLRDHAQ